MNNKTKLLVAAGACGACCAPLLWPFIAAAGIGTAGSAGFAAWLGANTVEILCIGALAALALGAVLVRRDAKKPASCDIGGTCDPKTRSS